MATYDLIACAYIVLALALLAIVVRIVWMKRQYRQRGDM